jgi:hypothetical protein
MAIVRRPRSCTAVERLTARGIPTRVGARSTGEPPFDWDDPDTWAPVLQGVGA